MHPRLLASLRSSLSIYGSSITDFEGTATPPRQAGPVSPRPVFTIVMLGVIAASIVYATSHGVAGIVPLAGLSVASVVILRVLSTRMPTLNLLANRSNLDLRREARPLLIFAVVFPLLTIPFVLWGRLDPIAVLPGLNRAGWVFSWNFLICKIALLLVPTIVFAVRTRSSGAELGLSALANPWRWIGPAIGALPICLVGAFLPLGLFLGSNRTLVPLWVVGIVALYVLLAGAIAEEGFYRVLLQSRLERLMGSWNGITLASVLFGAFHLPLHYATLHISPGTQALSQFFLVVAGILANQVVIGMFFGYMWSRFGNAWINVAVHLLFDAVTTILVLSGA